MNIYAQLTNEKINQAIDDFHRAHSEVTLKDSLAPVVLGCDKDRIPL